MCKSLPDVPHYVSLNSIHSAEKGEEGWWELILIWFYCLSNKHLPPHRKKRRRSFPHRMTKKNVFIANLIADLTIKNVPNHLVKLVSLLIYLNCCVCVSMTTTDSHYRFFSTWIKRTCVCVCVRLFKQSSRTCLEKKSLTLISIEKI